MQVNIFLNITWLGNTMEKQRCQNEATSPTLLNWTLFSRTDRPRCTQHIFKTLLYSMINTLEPFSSLYASCEPNVVIATYLRDFPVRSWVSISPRMLLIPGTGNGERGTGNRERESGNKCTAATRLRIRNGGQNKRKARRETIGVKVSFHRLCPQMTSTFL